MLADLCTIYAIDLSSHSQAINSEILMVGVVSFAAFYVWSGSNAPWNVHDAYAST